jgi:nitrogen fixation/metabolism regulation signal transduction histidine kinase
MNALLALGAVCGVVLALLLIWATGHSGRLDAYYGVLLGLNAVVALALFAWVVGLSWQLAKAYWTRQFGARLSGRFALAFAAVGVLPGLLLYLLSVQFLSRSIESWFNTRVESALEAGLALGRAALDAQLQDLITRGRSMSLELSDVSDTRLGIELTRLSEQAGISEAMLFTANGRMVAVASNGLGQLAPELPPATLVRQARSQGAYAGIDAMESAGREELWLRVIVPMLPRLGATSLGQTSGEQVFLQLLLPVADQIASNARIVQAGYNDYQQLSLSREGLRNLYGLTLTLALLLAVFAAVASAFYLSRKLTRPLLKLALATQKVGEGDFTPLPEGLGPDELAQLTRSFNAMTRQLAEAREQVEKNRQALLHTNDYLESILGHLSAGVLVLDRHGHVTRVNPGAVNILGHDPRDWLQVENHPALQTFLTGIRQAFSQHRAAGLGQEGWQRQFQLDGTPGGTTVLARGSELPGGDRVVVFDDITGVVSANRAVAWAEVARRLAHEIKNPLTPISLSAERLQAKLANRLEGSDRELLLRYTSGILKQVDAMRRMVNEFRDYSRLPPPDLKPLQINTLIGDLLHTYGYEPGDPMFRAPGGRSVRLHLALDPAAPCILGDAAQLVQVINNLIQNALDALLESGNTDPTLWIETCVQALDDGEPVLRLTLRDNGPGFAATVLQRAFEPYITTKPQGTGLGLAIVHKILEDHGARITLSNVSEGGARVSILFTRLAPASA